MRTKRIVSLGIVLMMLFTLAAAMSVSASAAYSALQMNVSSMPCSANLSASSLPECQFPTQGDTYYINLAGTTDYKLDRAEFYVKAPGQNSFSCIYDYNPSGYFRWVNCAYQFTQSGTYTVRLVVTATNGAQASGDMSVDVAARTSYTAPSTGNTYCCNGTTYNVVPNFKSEYCFNQMNYSRFVNQNGKNRGCTATAMCIAYSMYHDYTLSPNRVRWSNAGTSWEYCTYYSNANRTYRGNTYSQRDGLKAAYDCVLSRGRPIIVGVYGLSSDHVVTVVGVNQNADRNNLTLRDFLIVDPLGGRICTLNTYPSLDCGWGLRVPKN